MLFRSVRSNLDSDLDSVLTVVFSSCVEGSFAELITLQPVSGAIAQSSHTANRVAATPGTTDRATQCFCDTSIIVTLSRRLFAVVPIYRTWQGAAISGDGYRVPVPTPELVLPLLSPLPLIPELLNPPLRIPNPMFDP